MINLIRNELYKLIHKKSTFVILIIMFAFVVLTNYIYTRIYSNKVVISYDDYNYSEAISYINNHEINDLNYEDFIFYKTIISTKELVDKYTERWQIAAINDDIYQVYSEMYLNEFYKNTKDVEVCKSKLSEMIKKLDDGDWKYFVNKKIDNYKADLESIKNTSYQPGTSREKEALKSIERINIQIELLEYRLANDLPINGGTYLDDAINTIDAVSSEYVEYKLNPNSKNINTSAIQDYEMAKYVLDKKVNINTGASQRTIIIDFFSEYYFLILLFVIMISGAIVSDEFNKGTIKSLLILPYSRTKILLAKYISTIIALLFGIFAIFIMQMIVGGIFFGYSSLSVPFVTYNLTTHSIVEISPFAKFGLTTITMIPKLLLLGTLAFALSTVFINTAVAIAVTFCGYIGEQIVNMLALRYDVKFLNYFVTTNWNFNELLFGGKSQFGLSLTHSIIVCLAYLLLMIIVSFIVFKKRDIKNI